MDDEWWRGAFDTGAKEMLGGGEKGPNDKKKKRKAKVRSDMTLHRKNIPILDRHNDAPPIV